MTINLKKYEIENYYFCKICNYKCYTKFLIKQHLTTKKHKKQTNTTQQINKIEQTQDVNQKSLKHYTCSQCNKSYQDRSGLWKHKKTCTGPEEINQTQHTELKNTSDLAMMVKTMMEPIIQNIQDDKKVTLGLVEQMQTQNKIITDIIPKIGNNNNSNNRFNINVFLNEQCRDAINMTDFINSLQIKLADLMYTKNNGLIEGISSVFVNALNKLETCQRPIHCTDVKRETLYIKDNDAWERENSKEKLHTAISKVAHQQRKTITEWEKANKNWQESETGSQEYINLVREVTKDVVPEENKIIKNIIKETVITKDEVNDSSI